MEFLLVGVNHRTAPLPLRERLAVGRDALETLLPALRESAALDEALVLSTCNRTELLGLRRRGAAPLDEAALFGAFCALRGVEAPDPATVYAFAGEEAVRHLMRVAGGLDSMVLGESEVLGQVKQAYAAASAAGAAGLFLNRIAHAAFRAARRVRNETEIEHGAVSVAYVAVLLARKVFGDLKRHTALVVGAGEVAEAAAMHLSENGTGRLLFVNRTLEKAEALAARFHGESLAWDRLAEAFEHADVVVSSTGAPGMILTHEDFHRVMDHRRTRPIFLIDLAVPRDVDPAVEEHDNAFLYDVDSLQEVADANLERRRAAVPAAEAVIEEELEKLRAWKRSLAAEPVVKRLAERFENVRRCELDKSAAKMERRALQRADKLTLAIQKKLLHRPLEYLRACDPETEEGRRRIEVVRECFDLGEEE